MKKTTLLLLAIGIVAVAKTQNESYNKKNKDTSEMESIDEVLVSAQRFGAERSKTTRQIEVITEKQMQLAQQGNMADVLAQTGQVFVQKSQLGGGSPVLRGFEASRVLLVVDGVRMNNATYRSGHLQDIVTVDQFMLDRTEVFFGSGSTQYGSDALGGVVYLKTREPKFRDQPFGFVKSNANLRYLSAARAVVANVNLELSGRKVAWIFSSSSSDFGDLRMGKGRHFSQWDTFGLRKLYAARINSIDTMLSNPDPYVQLGTAYRQMDVFSKLSIKTGSLTHIFNAQLSGSSLVPRYDRMTDVSGGALRFATWNYAPQNRDFFSYTLLIPGGSKWNHRIILSTQNTKVGRVTRRFRNNNELTQLDRVNMTAVNYDFRYNLNKAIQFQGGVEWVYNKVSSQATIQNVLTGVVAPSGNTRYADGGATTSSGAAFVNGIWEIKPGDFIVEGGVRLTAYSLEARFTENNLLKLPYSKAEVQSLAPVYNVGFTKKMGVDGLYLKTSLSSGFRNPNVDDMTKLFESVSGRKLVIPNRNLKPERTRTIDLGVSYETGPLRIEFGGYHTRLTQFLMDRRSAYNGQDSILFDGQMTPVFQMDNTAEGFIRGMYFASKIKLRKTLYADFNYTSTFGRYRYSEGNEWQPLDHIAPDFGRVGLRWVQRNWQCEFFMLFNGQKIQKEYSPSGEDNEQYAPGGEMPAWETYNIRANWQAHKNLNLSFALENLLDLNYRTFSSGMSAPGRNLTATVKLNF